jgi:signal transduction histidine kinase
MVPLHLVAFFVLYLGTSRLLEQQVLQVASESASRQLDLANRELSQIAVAHTQNRALKHFFEAVLAAHQGINLKLLLPSGKAIGPNPSVSQAEVEALPAFLESRDSQLTWLSQEASTEQMRGFQKVIATRQCSQCHIAGDTLAIASMRLDVTGVLTGVRERSRRNVAVLIVAWAAALGLSTALVRASVRRSARRLEEELAAAEAGESVDSTRLETDLGLDSATARLHRSLKQFLERQRKRQAELASRMEQTDQLASLGRLAAGLAHEIKNPLAGIQGALEILKQDAPDGDPNSELYTEMLSELKRVNETLQTLLQSARPAPARLANTDLRQLLEDLRRLLDPGLRRQDIKLSLDIPDTELVAKVDSAKLRQVLINLVQNAAESMDRSGEITLRASSFAEDGGLVLAVQDNGPGISDENQQKIFDPFFTTKFGGTGLGLAISRSLIEQHGGSLEVQSETGEGSTFYILLPGKPVLEMEASLPHVEYQEG